LHPEKWHSLGVQTQIVPLGTRIPEDLRKALKATARRKNLTLNEFVLRTLQAAVASEEAATPGFLEAWEKFLTKHLPKKS
jgi:hypothetical protein